MKRLRALAGVVAVLCVFGVLGPGVSPAQAATLPLAGYGTSSGGSVCDTVNEINPAYSDVACAGSSGFVGSDGTTMGFGIVTETDPRTTQNGGPIQSTAYVIAIAVNGVQVATVGVDGKQISNSDYVYAKCFGNTTLTYNTLVTTATTAGTFTVNPMPGTSYYRVEFSIPLSALSTCGITASTQVQLYFGSSQAANLDVINKDFFRDGDTAVSFASLATITFGGSLTLSKTATPVSGPNPPAPGQTSTYDLAVTANDTSVYPLTSVQIGDDLPSGVTLVSSSATLGTVTVTGQHVDWSAFALPAGTSQTLTMRVSITPTGADVGSPVLLNAGASGSAARGDGVAVTATSNGVSSGVVAGPAYTLTKTASPTFVAAGGTVTYTLTLANTGNAAGSVSSVVDTLPSGFSFVAGSTGGTLGASAPGTAGSAVTWTGPFALAAGASKTLTFSALASSTAGSYFNNATANAGTGVSVSTGPTASVTVNAAPTAAADSATTARVTPVTVSVLANDSDPDGNPLTVTSVTTPSTGTATIDPTGKTVVYTPPAGFSGPATFSYTINDGYGGTSTALVTVTVSNAAPVAANDLLTASSGVATTANVLANDSDPDGDALQVISVTAPAHGTTSLVGGVVSYTAASSYAGSDAFGYTISDGHGGTASATVAVTVPNTAPTATDDSAATLIGKPVTVAVLANDTDPNTTQTLTVTSAGPAAHGTATVNPDGTITYTPTAGYEGGDSFDYTITDGATGTATATVTITVSAGTPIAVDDSTSTPTNTPTTVDVLTNDVGLGTLTVAPASITTPTNTPPVGPPGGPAGTATLNPDGTITYTPTSGYTGTATFTYAITNGTTTSTPATVTITVLNANPTATDDTATTTGTAPVTVTVLTNDSDANTGQSLSVTSAGPAAHGTVVVNADGTLTYTASAGYSGSDTFTYAVGDGAGGTSTATVTVTVVAPPVAPPPPPPPPPAPPAPPVVPPPPPAAPVNHPPAYTDAPANTVQAVPAGAQLDPLAATDPDGNALSYELVEGDLPPGVQLQVDGSFTGLATAAGSFPVVLRVCDDGVPQLCSQTRLVISVQAAAEAPSPSPDPVVPPPDPVLPPVTVGQAKVEPAPARPQLPHTGAPIAALVLTGLMSLVLGLGLVRASRRRSPA